MFPVFLLRRSLLFPFLLIGQLGQAQSVKGVLTDASSQVISLKRKPTKVLNASFHVVFNRSGALTFRGDQYRRLPDGESSNVKLLTRNILATSNISRIPVTVGLTPDQPVLEEGFFLMLEWIGGADASQVSNCLAFWAGMGYANNDSYLRQTSQANWERAAGAVRAGMQPKVSFYVTAQG